MKSLPWPLFFCLFFAWTSCQSDKPGQPEAIRPSGFEDLPPWSEDYPSEKEKWGFINESGSWAINARFDEVRPFSSQRAVVRQDGFWGIIDPTGKYIVEPKLQLIWPYAQGLARAKTEQGQYGYLNREGQWTISPKFDQAHDFSDGLAFVKKEEKSGFITADGKWAFSLSADRATPFYKGLTIFSHDGLYGVLDREGKQLFPPTYTAIQFSEGRTALILQKDSAWGVYNLQGEELLPFQTNRVSTFLDDRIAIEKNGKFYLIDLDLQEIAGAFEQLWPAGEGLWGVEQTGKFGYINNQGNTAIEIQWEMITKFAEGFAAVQIDERWTFIDSKGTLLHPPAFGLAWPFRNGWARVASYKYGFSYLSKAGRVEIATPCRDFHDFSEGLAAIQEYDGFF